MTIFWHTEYPQTHKIHKPFYAHIFTTTPPTAKGHMYALLKAPERAWRLQGDGVCTALYSTRVPLTPVRSPCTYVVSTREWPGTRGMPGQCPYVVGWVGGKKLRQAGGRVLEPKWPPGPSQGKIATHPSHPTL